MTKDSAAGVVAGVDAALNEVLVELVSWTVGGSKFSMPYRGRQGRPALSRYAA